MDVWDGWTLVETRVSYREVCFQCGVECCCVAFVIMQTVDGLCLCLRNGLHLLLKIYRTMDAFYGFGPQRMDDTTQSARDPEVSIEVPIALSYRGTLAVRSNIWLSSNVSERRNGLGVWI
jgi:hypothetical protein